jgi:alpha-glucosidase (family GH31 glycosyl hydrolase)
LKYQCIVFLLLSCFATASAQETFVLSAKNAVATSNIKKIQFFTGSGIATQNRDQQALAQYSIDVKAEAVFSVFVLAGLDNPVDGKNNMLEIETITNTKNEVKTIVQFQLNEHATKWYRAKETVTLLPGRHLVHINFLGNRMQYVEQLIFSSDIGFSPSGVFSQQDTIKPILPPAWAFGVLYGGYTNQQKTSEVVDSLIAGDFPIDAYWIDSWYWDFVNKGKGPKGYMNFMEDKQAFPNVQAMFANMQSKKIKSGVWMWNCIQREGNEVVFDSFYQKKYLKKPEINTDGWHNKTRLTINADVDFSNGNAVAFWKQSLQPQFDAGLDFLKLDRNSDLDYTKAAFEAAQELGKETKGRGFILNHLMMSDDPRFKLYPTKWSGDAKIAWSMPDYPEYRIPAIGALRENILMVADPSRTTYEIPFLTHDGGGYDFFGSKDFSDELYIRWAQFSLMNPVTTFFSTSNNSTRNHPYAFPDSVQQNFKEYAHLKMRLFPYVYSYAMRTHLAGKKMIEGDNQHPYQYLFGQELLIAPVYEKNARQQTVFLPAGKWMERNSRKIFDGNQAVTVDAPLTVLPIFIREGAIIPFRNYARAIELGNNDSLEIHVWPAASQSNFILYEDDGLSNDYLKGGYTATQITAVKKNNTAKIVVAAAKGNYEGMKTKRFWRLLMRAEKPTTVLVNGKKNKKWGYDAERNLVIVETVSEVNKPLMVECR